MKIAIRMDDITSDMNWENFERLQAAFDKAGVYPLLGLVPASADPHLHITEERADFWEEMKRLEQKGCVLCQHGFDHCYSETKGGLFPLNRFSEFAGASYEQQLADIRKGKKILESHGIVPTLFMAPGHTYDKNTLRALKACGFTGLTDGFGTAPYLREGLIFYPIASRKGKVFDGEEGYTTLVIHANSMNDGEIAWYERMLSEHSKEFISYKELLQVPAQKRGGMENLSEYLRATAKRILVKLLGMLRR